MIHLFYAMSTVYMVHRLFTLFKPNNENLIHFIVEFTFVIWVFAGLFTHIWYMYLLLIICGQIGVTVNWFVNPFYHLFVMRLLCILDIILLLIINCLNI